MKGVRVFLFWLLVPVLFVLFAAPVFIAHLAAHVLMDRMRRTPEPVRKAPVSLVEAPQ
jgi:hypothetical protein